MTFKDRALASMLAFACGDALGATVEFLSPAEIKKTFGIHTDIIGGGWLRLDPGEVTDDTQMALCIARSLIECSGFEVEDIADRFVEWFNSDPADIGATCRAGIQHYIRSGSFEAPYDDCGAGNGGVMRELPLILYYHQDRECMLKAVVSQSRLTHNNRESDLGCCCYAELVAAALAGFGKDDLRSIAAKYPAFAPEAFEGKSGGYVVETLRTVLHYFFATSSLENYIVAVVNRGEDADTTGALAGGLAGAFYGYDAMPARWLDALDENVHKELVQFVELIFSNNRVTEPKQKNEPHLSV